MDWFPYDRDLRQKELTVELMVNFTDRITFAFILPVKLNSKIR